MVYVMGRKRRCGDGGGAVASLHFSCWKKRVPLQMWGSKHRHMLSAFASELQGKPSNIRIAAPFTHAEVEEC